MKNIKEESRCLASLAVFRELYNSEKDVYGIIGEFLKEVINYHSKFTFSLTEITCLLNDTYDFNIPEAVISTSLSRLKDYIKKDQGRYTLIDNSLFSQKNLVSDKHSQILNDNAIIIEDLFIFISQQLNKKLTEDEKSTIIHSFCAFILDETTQLEYSEYISAFVVKGEKNYKFISQLNTIKEGVVLYAGLRYNSKLNELGAWNTELTIYIETEILFHFAGYNGKLYQVLFSDFYKLIEEINKKSLAKGGKRLIKLKYFTEIKDEIDRFFRKAEFIVSGQDTANPSKAAMVSIINGCKTPAEIIEKKTKFYELLRSNGIHEDDYKSYYNADNYKYNLEDECLLKEISSNTEIEDPRTYLKYLNYINIHRRGESDRWFENIRYILLSGTRNTLVIAWDECIKASGEIPLASDLNFLTNKFWFNLNKGFGSEEYPKSFDIITKAQIILSTQLNDSVACKFDELQAKSKKGELTEREAVLSITELRRQARKPEDINEYDIQDVLKSISENSIELFLEEQEFFKNQAQKQILENEELKASILEIKKEQEENSKNTKQMLRAKESEFDELKEELQKYKDIELKKKEKRKKKKIVIKRIALTITFMLIMLISIYGYLYFNNLFAAILAILAIIGTIVSIVTFFGFDYRKIKKRFGK